ncbi:DUF4856 domain-containing protein [Nonlabens arenilitoris]|uniref:DUF4856 domain-containing protein n=1 Tax=Nonlabens arenilitoris TaxID=1217969 RepID=A0A2S7UB51_9FLAO|nr:DUF4856 domain-containing protein [Nonlabens arenilitoris]PQJ32155.1 DUF4856 domain-containing protein [Nonlabens arenilitoris]
MTLRKISLIATAVLAIFLTTSCDNDDDMTANNVIAPATYSFTRGTESTVSYSGQTTRIAMAEEIKTAFKETTTTETQLANMFAHVAGSNDFSDADLNASDKSVRSKVAASADYFSSNATDAAAIRADFDNYISSQVNDIFPAWNNTASAGVPGQIQQAGGGTIRYVNAKGLEYDQAFAKGLLGALMSDQILNNYLSTTVLDESTNRADNDNDILVSGKNYTNMEHKWDEAFGYLYGAEPDATAPVLDQDSFLSEYIDRVESDADFAGIASTIYDAFKLGRQAIVDKNYSVRDEQAAIIRENISLIPAVRAVFYLQNGKDNLTTDPARAFHGLSEAYGFIYSLQFTRNPITDAPYFSKTEVDNYLNQLMTGNGFWDVTPATLDQISDDIAARFNFTTTQASN